MEIISPFAHKLKKPQTKDEQRQLHGHRKQIAQNQRRRETPEVSRKRGCVLYRGTKTTREPSSHQIMRGQEAAGALKVWQENPQPNVLQPEKNNVENKVLSVQVYKSLNKAFL